MKLGADKTVVYERETIVKEKGFFQKPRYTTNEVWQGMVLAFCGKYYPFVYNYELKKIIWDVEEAVATLPKSKWRYRGYWNDDSLDTDISIRKFFNRQYPEFDKYFHEFRTPIFGFEPTPTRSYYWRKELPYRALTLSPVLKDLEFYKVKDPITAFQDIYIFISGVIGTQPKPKEKIDDKIMAASKGHDGEYSFKKPPGKRGKNKWR